MDWISTSPLVKTYTLEEFWEIPEPPDRVKFELIAGVLYLTPPPSDSHSICVSQSIRLLYEHLFTISDRGMVYFPRAGIVKGPNTWLEPDFFYVAAKTEARLDPQYPQYKGTADVVVEIISPESAIYDRNTKADTYAALGVKELWLVDEASGIIEVRVLQGDRYGPSVVHERDDHLKSTVLPDLEMRVGDVFGN